REEVPMPIVGGLDIHRRQLTFDYLDTVTGEVRRGQIVPADRAHLRAWLARFAGRGDVAFAVEGCTGWRYVSEELAVAGIAAHVGEPADTAAARGRKRHAKTDKADARHLRTLLAEGRLPECWIPPTQILEYRALLETYHDLRAEHTAWAQRRGVLPPGRSPAGRGHVAHRAGPGRPAGRRGGAPVAGRAAAGRHRLGHARRRRGPAGPAAPPAARGRPASDRREGAGGAAVRGRAGHRAGADLLAGRGRPVLLLPQGGPVHRAGASPCTPRPQRTPRAAVPARDRRCCAGRCMRPAKPTPSPRPPPTATTPQSPTATTPSAPPCRGPQDRPAGLPHSHRARRRRAHRRLNRRP